jgi:Flp pilus assembly protein protease CpaA
MVVGLLLSFLIGWLIGGVANWLADQLPYVPQRSLHFDRARYWRSLRFATNNPPASADPDITSPDLINPDRGRPLRNGLLNVAMALAFAMGWWRFGSDVGQLIFAWFYTTWLLLVLVIDFEHHRVLNIMLPAAILVTLLAPLFAWLGWADLPTFNSTLLGGLAGFALFLVIYLVGRGRMMGAGDLKLAGVIGLMIGYPLVWGALMAGIFLGGIAAIFLLVRYRAAKSYMAYGPYLALGALLVLWFYWPWG